MPSVQACLNGFRSENGGMIHRPLSGNHACCMLAETVWDAKYWLRLERKKRLARTSCREQIVTLANSSASPGSPEVFRGALIGGPSNSFRKASKTTLHFLMLTTSAVSWNESRESGS